jgi:predicted nucleic acid-binding protein
MNFFWDTSAVLSLVLKDSNGLQAARTLAASSSSCRHITSPLVAIETENRLHYLHLTGRIDAAAAQGFIEWAAQLFATKQIHLSEVSSCRRLAAECQRMIRHFSAAKPHKTMDLLHVASARLLRAEGFFTFDSNQSALAAAAGFQIIVS